MLTSLLAVFFGSTKGRPNATVEREETRMTKKLNPPAKGKPTPAPKAATASKSKTPSKVAAKTPVKVAPKTAVKSANAAPVKAVAKAPVKVAAKAPVKAPAKAPAKAPVKVVAKTAAKPVAKTPAKAPVKATASAPAKSAAKVPVKAPVKVAAKAAAKVPVKAPVKAPVKTPVKAPLKTQAKAPVKVAAKVPPKAAPVVAPKPLPVPPKPSNHAVRAPATPPLKPSVQGPKVVAGQTIIQPQNKKSSRGAKAASMVPPPPLAVVSTNAAKSSFGPADAPSLPSVIPVIPKKDSKLANNWKTKSVPELTDAEVIAMPDAEYMNETQMAFFRHKLSLLKQDMLNNAGQTTENLREDTVVVPDPADRATIEEEHALELRTRDRERKLLKKIEQSIQRIDAGDYGYCDETGEAIGVGRLLARPTATLSLEAQQRRELKQKMFGD